ncbi:MAG: phospholipase D-like domain-containing protein [Candidatus Eremiobacterota bacterium]
MKDDHVALAVTGLAWMKGRAASIDRVLSEMLLRCRQELLIVSYSFTEGAEEFLTMLEDRLRDGIRVKVVINRLSRQPPVVISRLTALLAAYPRQVELFDFSHPDTELHAKVVVSDRREALVGSANLSYRGLVRNYELAVRIEGATAVATARAIDALVSSQAVHRISVD